MTMNLIKATTLIMMQKTGLCNKDLITVSLKCFLVRTETRWKMNTLALIRLKEPVHGFACAGIADLLRIDQAIVFIQCHQSAVKGFIVKRIQTKTIVGIGSFSGIFAPGNNMACNQ